MDLRSGVQLQTKSSLNVFFFFNAALETSGLSDMEVSVPVGGTNALCNCHSIKTVEVEKRRNT